MILNSPGFFFKEANLLISHFFITYYRAPGNRLFADLLDGNTKTGEGMSVIQTCNLAPTSVKHQLFFLNLYPTNTVSDAPRKNPLKRCDKKRKCW